MIDFLGKRIQKAMEKANNKTSLKEEDLLEITREIKLALLEADVNLVIVKEFIKEIKEKAIGAEIIGKLNPGQQMVKIVNDELIKILGGKTKEIKLEQTRTVIMMAGLQGSGKTTSTAKLASYFLKRKKVKKVLMIAADVYRPAAMDQLIVLGKQINVDVYFEKNNNNAQLIVENGMKKAKEEFYDLVIIDTAGRLSIDEKLMQELVDIKKIAKPSEIIFVADSLSGQDIINVAKTFNQYLNLTSSIITKLDSDARGGAAFSITKLLNIPIAFIGTGEKINNFDLFHPDRMANRILGMGDVLSIIEKAEEVIDKDKAEKIGRRLMSGNFDLDDLLNSLNQMKKMGKFSKLIKLIPGMPKNIDLSKVEGADQKIKLYEILISSMTMQERKNPKLLKNTSRKNRIIKGSGRTVQEYNQLVNEFETLSKRMKEMSKNGMGGMGGLFK
ncbi:signal recognition particle protein [Mesomycoplasma lagogenitalium]|uniref:Signal recognition particle protein n=1 Tax=Mesomycoplasma lagogenitalium TaxID=171286 RepID=A0ABY8LSZ9_9BACT|nr:signal recognition particle protein [Mesomycoplasma lagogenitalium]WGI36374.1 signal recognition particle protein [Mesomycoplasma lagogenitalium]